MSPELLEKETILVRCKNCKHYSPNAYSHNGISYGKCDKLAIGLGVYSPEDWYCAEGVKKDDG